jgi:hypothetical protein
MVQRHDTEGALAAAVQVLRDMGKGGGAFGAVPARHALGPSGRARRVEQQRQILRPGLRLEPAGGAAQFFEAAGAAVFPADRNPRQPLRRHGAGDGGRGGIVENDSGGFGIGKAIVQLFGFCSPVERGHYDTRELTRPMQARHFEPVLQDHGQPVAAFDAERRQPARHARDLGIPRRIAEPPLPIVNRHCVGTAFDCSKKGPAQIKHDRGPRGV